MSLLLQCRWKKKENNNQLAEHVRQTARKQLPTQQ